MKRTPALLGLLSFAVLIASGTHDLSAALILEYNFNGTGNTVTNSGPLGASGNLTFLNSAGAASNLYSAAGGGVSGLPGDLAFDNTASTGMGNAGTGGRAQSTANFTNLGTVQSFSIQGWYNADAIGNGAKLFELTGGGVITLASNATNRLSLTVNGTFSQSAASTVYDDSGSWVFFGVTYDGTLTSNNVKFYAGTENSAVSLVNTTTLNQGARPVGFTSLAIGNSYGSNSRPFDGSLDDIRFFDSTTGADGALTLAQMEALRTADIPEPSSVGLLSAAALVFFGRRKTRRLSSPDKTAMPE